MISLLKEYKFLISSITLLVLIFLLYFKSIFFQYAWDDSIILDNELVYNGLEGLNELFIKNNSILLKDNFGFRPLTLLSFKLEFLVFGVNSKVSHFFNILIYITSIFFIFFIIKKHFKSENIYFLLFGLTIFSFHPIHVEVVSNVKSRDELLGLLFSLLGIIYILKAIKTYNFKYIFLSILLFVIAMLCKEIEAILLIITSLSLVYFHPLERKKTYFFSIIGFLIIAILFPYSLYYKVALFFSLLILILMVDLLLNNVSLKYQIKNLSTLIVNKKFKENDIIGLILFIFILNLFLRQDNLINYSLLSVLLLYYYQKNNNKTHLLFLILTTGVMIFLDINKTPLYILISFLPFLLYSFSKKEKALIFYYLFLAILFSIITFFEFSHSSLLSIIVFLAYPFLLIKKVPLNTRTFFLTIIFFSLTSFFYINFVNINTIQFNNFISNNITIETSKIFRDMVKEDYVLGNQFIHLEYKELIPNSFNVLLNYLKNYFYPINLKYYYGYNQIPLIGYTNLRFYLSIAIHSFLVGLIIRFRKKDKIISFFSFSYLISISIFSHLLIKLPDAMADRFFFIPSIFLSFLVALLIQKLYYKVTPLDNVKKNIIKFFSFILILSLLYQSFQRQEVWKSNKILFSSDIKRLNNCSRCHYNLAIELSKEYELTKEINLQEKIVFHFKKAIEIFPNVYHARLKLALMLKMFGESEKATIELDELIHRYIDNSEPYFEKGKILFENKKYLESFKLLDKSIQLFGNNPNYYYYQAWAAFNINSIDNAIKIAEFAKNKFPENYMFPDALSEFYNMQGERVKAIKVLENYLVKYPNNQTILNKISKYK